MKFSKLALQLTGSATMAATLRAQELKRQGHDIVLATVGEPDIDVDQKIKQALTTHLSSLPSKYGSSQGLLSTRQAISNWFKKVYEANFSAENILVTPGSKFALYALLQILCDADDEVVIPAPYWVSYVTLAEMAKAKAVVCPPDANYKLTAKLLTQSLTAKSRVLMLNSPNNPTGAVYSTSELRSLYEVLKGYPDVTVICDDIYNQLLFSSDDRAPSLLDVVDDEFRKRIVVVHGVSKSYAMTGWRQGWIASYDLECIKKMNAFCSQTLTCTPDFIQKATEVALNEGDAFVSKFKEQNRKKYEWAYQELQSIKKISVYKSDGAFYIWIKILDTTLSSTQIVENLLSEKGLAVVPGESFGMPDHLRLSVALSTEEIKKATKRLKEFFA